jgi:hypothetical protein
MHCANFWALLSLFSSSVGFAAETLARTFITTGDKSAGITVFGFRGTDNKTYVLTGDPGTFTLPVSLPAGVISSFVRNGAAQSLTLDTINAANNRPAPFTLLAGDSLAPVAVGAGATTATTLRVSLATDSAANRGLNPVQLTSASSFPYVIDMASINITNAAYVQVIASVSKQIDAVDVFSANGQPVFLAVGGAGAEVNQIAIIPGGQSSPIPVKIAAGSRISLKSAGANLTSGYFILNAYSRD